MSAIKDGGPAFPVVGMAQLGTQEVYAIFQSGMTLRDYFAAKAMQGLLATPDMGGLFWEELAHRSVKMSDALLAELAK